MQIKFINELKETDHELARREYITRSVLFASFSTAFTFTLISLILFLLSLLPLDTLLIYAGISLVILIAMFLTNKGYWRTVGIIPPLLMYFPAINANYIGGIDAPGNFLYAILIMFVAIIYGHKKMWLALFICLATYLCLAVLIFYGIIKPFRSGETVFINRIVITIGCLISISYLIWIVGRSYNTELSERRKAEKMLYRNNEELESVNEELQATIEELEATNEEFEALNTELLKSQDELVDSNEKLKKSEQKFYQIFHSSPVPMTLNDHLTGNYIELNDSLIKQTGYSREEMIGKNPLDIGLFSIKTLAIVNSILTEKGILVNHELQAKMKNGAIRNVIMNAYVTEFNNRKCTITASIDITEKKSYEENLIKTQRLESLGLIASGLAHDFNNILMGILGNLSLARLHIDDSRETLLFIDNSEEACIRAQGLTRQLLTFSKGGNPVKSRFNPENLVLNALKFNLAGSKVKASTMISSGLWNIEADEAQISQVVNNLILNAVQSMSSGGILNITMENHTIKPENIKMLSTGLSEPGNFVMLTIEDNGHGIPACDLSKIFDPYYTTKKSGTGLGLSVVYSIINNHGGYINVESKEGSGSLFTIYLPAAEKNSIESVQQNTESSPTGKTSPVIKNNQKIGTDMPEQKILIMDDEESILSVLKGMLSHLGYKSDGAKSGTEAVELYKKSCSGSNPYLAVIMDLTIPGDIGGKEAILLLKDINPEIKAIVSSGYSDDPVFTDHSSYGFKAILRKPFRIDELSDALKKTLG
jgi:PAS domain S-box-containing protein